MLLFLMIMLLRSDFQSFSLIKNENTDPRLRSLVDTELAFAAEAESSGIRAAFLTFLDDSGIVFHPGPVNGKTVYRKRNDNRDRLRWKPVFADLAESGELGYTTGPWELIREQAESGDTIYGQYISIWKKGNSDERPWRLICDVGISHPKPGYALGEVNTFESPYKFASGEISPAPSDQTGHLISLDALTSDFCHERGITETTRTYYSDQIRYYCPDQFPVLGKEELLRSVETNPVERSWTTAGSDISSNIGYTYGTMKEIQAGKSKTYTYLRIWKSSGCIWHCVLEVLNNLPDGN